MIGNLIFNRFIIHSAVIVAKHFYLLSEDWSNLFRIRSFGRCNIVISAFLLMRVALFLTHASVNM
jgi:hypothetical protein